MNPDEPPVLPKFNTFYHHAATFCLLAPFIGYAVLICLLGYLTTHRPQSHLGAIIHVVIQEAPLVFGFAGFIFGIVALLGIRRHGAAGILGKVLAGFLIFLLVGILASQGFHDALVEISWQPPSMLAQKIVEIDRVVIADYFVHSNDESVPISISGDKAKEIANAVSLSRRDAGNYTSMFGRKIEFYKGSNLLASVRWQGRLFLTDEGQFSDNSGMLNSLYHELFMK